MAKSKYPSELDTSKEIPQVRDNLVEVGSDVINSIRSAIFNIERTLGINPHGVTGQTLAERLNRVLDAVGNLKPEALLTNISVSDVNVSEKAGIKESKLNLNYPTNLLQSEISDLSYQYSQLISELENLTSLISIHISENALNRHPATAISIDNYEPTASDTSLKNIDDGNLQTFSQNILDKHILYSGEDISEDNNSHLANQIYFDSTNISSLITSDDVQAAIEDLATVANLSQITHQDLHHSNGSLKTGVVKNSSTQVGNQLTDSFNITFVSNSKKITVLTPFEASGISKSDIITITDPNDTDEIYSKDYQIDYVVYDGSNLSEIYLTSNILGAYTSQTEAIITRNIKQESSYSGFLLGIRQDAGYASSKYIQISNPNSIFIKSKNIEPTKIDTTTRYIKLYINDDFVILDLYNSNTVLQTIDSIIANINEQAAEQHYRFLAYKSFEPDYSNEIVISYNIPSSDSEVTLKVSRGSDDAIDAGFAHIEDVVFSSVDEVNYYINGNPYTGLKKKLDVTGLIFNPATRLINNNPNVNFLQAGIRPGDLITISGADESSDDGSYIISVVSEDQLLLESDLLPLGFTGQNLTTTDFKIYSNSISLKDIIFQEVDSTYGSSLIQVFLDNNRELSYTKLLEYAVPLYGTNELFTIVDASFDEIGQCVLKLSKEANDDTYFKVSLDGGNFERVSADDSTVELISGTSNKKIKVYFRRVGRVINRLNSDDADVDTTIYLLGSANKDFNLIIGNVPFSNYTGKLGSVLAYSNITHKLEYGNISYNEINKSVVEKLLTEPTSELRSNGVVSGLNVSGYSVFIDQYYVNIDGGICYVNGKRIVVDSYESLPTGIDSNLYDKIFIAVDDTGTIKFKEAVNDCESPFNPKTHCLLATLEYDDVVVRSIDLRLFINDIDLRILNAITVSPVQGLGHFTSFEKAIKYAKRFTQLFPKAGTPSIHLKAGLHQVTIRMELDYNYSIWETLTDFQKAAEEYTYIIQNGLCIDFPVTITGEGDSTVVEIINKFVFTNRTVNSKGKLLVIGEGTSTFSAITTKFNTGSSYYSNFKMKNCSIDLVDLNIQSNDGYGQLNFSQNIDGITFDFLDYTDSDVDQIGPRSINMIELDDQTEPKGNIYINNCKFYTTDGASNSAVINVINPIRLRNFTCSNCKLYCEDDDNNVRLFSEDIFSFNEADSGSNINIFGNTSASNFNTEQDSSAPKMSLGTSGWADRVNRSLYVGGAINAVGDLDADNGNFSAAVTAAQYNYNSTQSRYKYIFFENIHDLTRGQTTNSAELDHITIDGKYWTTAKYGDNVNDFIIVRIELNPGETLDDVNVYFKSENTTPSITFSGYDLEIRSFNVFGDHTVELSSTDMGTIDHSNGNLAEVAAQGISNIGLAGANNKHYLLKITRNSTSGYAQHLLYIQYKVNLTSVQAIAGLF